MDINLKEIMEQLRQAENRGKKQEPEISVTIKAEGGMLPARKSKNSVMHMSEDRSAVVGCLGRIGTIRACGY